ncbi:MAG: NUDIX domain-containing protein [Brachymonas sp.]|jgi:ADP-ribose pyrophosphatase
MNSSHLDETLIASRTVHQGHFLTLKCDTVRLPDGQSATREYVQHPGAVVVLALTDDGCIVLEKQFRYPVGRAMIELPAGKLDAGESPLQCGQRELREETGYTASHWAYAGQMHLAIGYSTEVIHIYFARGLQQQDRQLDEGEFLDVYAQRIAEFLQDCDTQRITDAKTLSCAYYLLRYQAGLLTPNWQSAA